MTTMDGNLVTLEDDTINANQVKDLVLDRLLKNKVITNEQCSEYYTKWGVVVVKRGWFAGWLKTFNKKASSSAYLYRFVRLED